jgi:hypothetical protein
MKNLLLTITFSVLGYTSFAAKANESNKKMETIILVHGAWADVSSWDAVIPLLKAQGGTRLSRLTLQAPETTVLSLRV